MSDEFNELRRDYAAWKSVTESEMKTAKAENQSAYDRLRADIYKMGIGVGAAVVTILGLFMAFLEFFPR